MGIVAEVFLINLITGPEKVMGQLEALVNTHIKQDAHVGLIGYAIGGYYATYLAAKYHVPTILINPLMAPYELPTIQAILKHDQALLRLAQEQLAAYQIKDRIPSDKLLLILKKDSSSQDHQQVLHYYQGINQIILNDRNLQNLDNWLQPMSYFFKQYDYSLIQATDL